MAGERPRCGTEGSKVPPRASGAQLPAPGPGLGQRRSHCLPRLSDSYYGYALVVLAAGLLLEAGVREAAAGTPWLCGAARDVRRLGHPRAGEARTTRSAGGVEVTAPMTAGEGMNGRTRTCARAWSAVSAGRDAGGAGPVPGPEVRSSCPGPPGGHGG